MKGKNAIIPVIAIIVISALVLAAAGGGAYYINKLSNEKKLAEEKANIVEQQKNNEIETLAEQNKNLTSTVSNLEGKVDKVLTENKTVCKNVSVPYSATETYTEKEPYTAQSCSNVSLKYSYTQALTYYSQCVEMNNCLQTIQNCTQWNWLHTSCQQYEYPCIQWGCSKMVKTCYLQLKNIDDTTGNFAISVAFKENGVQSSPSTQQKSVGAQVEQLFTWDYTMQGLDGNAVSCEIASENIPKKQVCENVIAYRDVPKTRTVTKYRTEQQCS